MRHMSFPYRGYNELVPPDNPNWGIVGSDLQSTGLTNEKWLDNQFGDEMLTVVRDRGVWMLPHKDTEVCGLTQVSKRGDPPGSTFYSSSNTRPGMDAFNKSSFDRSVGWDSAMSHITNIFRPTHSMLEAIPKFSSKWVGDTYRGVPRTSPNLGELPYINEQLWHDHLPNKSKGNIELDMLEADRFVSGRVFDRNGPRQRG